MATARLDRTTTHEESVSLTVNGRPVVLRSAPTARLSGALREELGLTGTKVGCDAGDCGACTVLVDGEQACACLVPVGRCGGRAVTTVEGLAADPRWARLRESFLAHGAAQCGICTPGMLVAAADLLARQPEPSAAEVEDGLGGVLCRCTGYRKIVDAVLDAATQRRLPAEDGAMGARLVKLDGRRKVDGTEVFGADRWPTGCLTLRLVRSPHHRARFASGDLAPVLAAHPGSSGSSPRPTSRAGTASASTRT
jgi:aerobic-type carbon monoxide dehydrogenase small subunit (CoxS/CutS family)